MLSLRPSDPIAMRERVATHLICRAGDRLRVIEKTSAIRKRGQNPCNARVETVRETSGPPSGGRELPNRTTRRPETPAGSAECACRYSFFVQKRIKILKTRGEDSSLKQGQLRFHKVSGRSRQRESREQDRREGNGNGNARKMLRCEKLCLVLQNIRG